MSFIFQKEKSMDELSKEKGNPKKDPVEILILLVLYYRQAKQRKVTDRSQEEQTET